jgi:hypothetical protein
LHLSNKLQGCGNVSGRHSNISSDSQKYRQNKTEKIFEIHTKHTYNKQTLHWKQCMLSTIFERAGRWNAIVRHDSP